MKKKKIGSLTLAITLIAIGVIYLINIYTPLDIFETLRIMFASSIILLGVEFIFYEWFYKKTEKALEVKISGWSIILLLIIYGSSFSITGFTYFVDGNYENQWFERVFDIKNVYEFTEHYTEDANNLQKLVIDNSQGDIDIQTIEAEDILIEAVIKVRTFEDESYASDIANQIIKLSRGSGEHLNISANYRGLNTVELSTSVQLIIKMPKHLEVELNNKYGDIHARNIDKYIAINNRHGNTKVEHVGSECSIENTYGDVEVIDVKGSTVITNKHGKIEAKDIKSDLELKNEYELTSFDNIAGTVTVNQMHGTIEGSEVKKDLTISAEYSGIQVDGVNGKTDIKNSYEVIRVKNIQSNIKLRSRHGDLFIEDSQGDIDIVSEHGNIELYNPDTELKSVEIDSSYGDVTLKVPNQQQGLFDLSSSYGTIKTDMNLKVNERYDGNDYPNQLANEDNNSNTVNQTIGESENTITIAATHGNINIR